MEEKDRLKTKYIDPSKTYRDYKNSIDTARDEGKAEKTIEIAKNAKILGLTTEQIQKLTNLSIEEIEKLI